MTSTGVPVRLPAPLAADLGSAQDAVIAAKAARDNLIRQARADTGATYRDIGAAVGLSHVAVRTICERDGDPQEQVGSARSE